MNVNLKDEYVGKGVEVPEEENGFSGISVHRRLWSKLNHIIYRTKYVTYYK